MTDGTTTTFASHFTPAPSAYFHAIPLHYVPTLLATGALLSQRRASEQGIPIRPRITATRRDRKLQLDRYIHLSLLPVTPLLVDKRQRGYPHALLRFVASVADSPDAAYLRFNPKSWRHRDDFVPVTDSAEKASLLVAWRTGRYPSAELLIPDILSLAQHCTGIYAASRDEETWMRLMTTIMKPAVDLPIILQPDTFPPAPPLDLQPHYAYATACLCAGCLLPPPDLPFD